MTLDQLSKEEINELTNLLLKVFNYLNDLRSNNSLAERIQFPKIPPVLSESIVAHLLREHKLPLELNTEEINFGGKRANIIAKTANGEKLIEVKATGIHGFESLSERDINADLLIWVHFADFFHKKGDKPIEVFILKQPKECFKEPLKLTLTKFKAFDGVIRKEIKISEL